MPFLLAAIIYGNIDGFIHKSGFDSLNVDVLVKIPIVLVGSGISERLFGHESEPGRAERKPGQKPGQKLGQKPGQKMGPGIPADSPEGSCN